MKIVAITGEGGGAKIAHSRWMDVLSSTIRHAISMYHQPKGKVE